MIYDSDFLARLRQRDSAACTQFWYDFAPKLENKLRYHVRDHATVEDLRNETLCRVLVQVDKNGINDCAQFGSFVLGVCRNVILEHVRKRKTIIEWTEEFEPADSVPRIDELLAIDEVRELLRRDLKKLSENDRELIDEIYFEGRDRESLARERGIAVSSLNVKLHRAMKRLRGVFLGRTESRAADVTGL